MTGEGRETEPVDLLMSNAAIIVLTNSAGKELLTTRVIVIAIAPTVASLMNGLTAPEVLAHVTSLIPMRPHHWGREWQSSSCGSWRTDQLFRPPPSYDISVAPPMTSG